MHAVIWAGVFGRKALSSRPVGLDKHRRSSLAVHTRNSDANAYESGKECKNLHL